MIILAMIVVMTGVVAAVVLKCGRLKPVMVERHDGIQTVEGQTADRNSNGKSGDGVMGLTASSGVHRVMDFISSRSRRRGARSHRDGLTKIALLRKPPVLTKPGFFKGAVRSKCMMLESKKLVRQLKES